jgi:hypothetical protein
MVSQVVGSVALQHNRWHTSKHTCAWCLQETLAERKAARREEREALGRGEMPDSLKKWRVRLSFFPFLSLLSIRSLMLSAQFGCCTHIVHTHTAVQAGCSFRLSLVLSVKTALTAAAAYLAAAGHARLALHVVGVTRISQVMCCGCWLLWWHACSYEQLPLCLVIAARGFIDTSVCVTPSDLATDLSPLEMELCLVGVLHNASMWCCPVLC